MNLKSTDFIEFSYVDDGGEHPEVIFDEDLTTSWSNNYF